MKCIFVGVFKEGSTNVAQLQGLETSGVGVKIFEYRRIIEGLKKIKNLAGGTPEKERDNCLIDLINCYNADFILTAKGSGINSRVFDQGKHVLWYMDTMNNFNDELKEKIKKSYAVACAWKGPYEAAKKINPNTYWIPEGFDPSIDKPEEVEKCYDVSFIGSLDSYRKKVLSSYPVKLINNAYGENHAHAVSLSKININIVREGGSSDRFFKVLAAKGFLLSQKWDGMDELFNGEEVCGIFQGAGDLAEKIDYYLKRDDLREEIAERGFKLVQKYSRLEWAKKIKEIACQ